MPPNNLAVELRPSSLNQVIGHDSIKPTIRKNIEQECRHWLFHGPTGTGKTTLAYIVAREIRGLNCPVDPPDVQEINAANLNGIADIRHLVELASYQPMVGKYRVIILDEAHMLTPPAQTALLKPLEETDARTVWVLCTTDRNKLAQPLRDRCPARFRLEGMGIPEQRKLVSRAAEYRKYTADTSKFLNAIAGFSSARDILASFECVCNGMSVEDAVEG